MIHRRSPVLVSALALACVLVPAVRAAASTDNNDAASQAPTMEELAAATYEGFDGERIAGSSGCNRYQGSIALGELPGDFVVTNPMAGTMMACSPPIDEAEARFLEALQKASRFRFMAGRLVIDWNDGESWGSLAFAAED